MIHAVSCKDSRPALAANGLGPGAAWKVRWRAIVRCATHNNDDVSKALQMLRCKMYGWNMIGV